MKRRHIPSAEIVRRYQDGESQAVLARDYEVSPATIRARLVRAGVTLRKREYPRGQDHHWYGDGVIKDRDGYRLRLQHEHPHADHKGYVREHRLVMEERLGRFLEPHEVVHHINGVKSDNRPENLRLYERHAEHFAEHMRGNQYWRERQHRNPKVKLSVQEMKALYEQGHTLAEIADQAGVSYQTVGRRIQAAGVRLRSKSEAAKQSWTGDRHQKALWKGTPEWPLERIVAEYRAGRSLRELAQEIPVAVLTLSRCLRENGVRVRSKAEQRRLQSGGRLDP